MLYLIRTYGGPKFNSLLKIGFSDNIEQRMTAIKSVNPGMEILDTKSGDMKFESLIHFYLIKRGFQYNEESNPGREWFLDNPEVIEVFHSSQEKIKDLIWEHRDEIFEKVPHSREDLDKLEFHTTSVSSNKDFYRKLNDYLNELKEYILNDSSLDPEIVKGISLTLDKFSVFDVSMEIFCNAMNSFTEEQRTKVFDLIDEDFIPFGKYYKILGPTKCKARKYRKEALEKELFNLSKKDELSNIVYSTFELNTFYSNRYLKQVLSDIFKSLGITTIPKATMLSDYFDFRRTKKVNNEKIKVDGIILTNRKK